MCWTMMLMQPVRLQATRAVWLWSRTQVVAASWLSVCTRPTSSISDSKRALIRLWRSFVIADRFRGQMIWTMASRRGMRAATTLLRTRFSRISGARARSQTWIAVNRRLAGGPS